MINIEGLTKSFGSKKVLNHLQLNINRPGIYALIGKNGAGKTTLFEILAGMQTKDAGKIIYQGKSELGYLSTDQYFYPRMTGKEYLEFCLHARKLPTENFDKYNSLFELPLQKEVNTYSSGMKKKLGIMGLLVQDNNVLILDEPYNGLDIESVLLVGKLLKKLEKVGKTILISSHILSSITDITSKLFFLQNGVISDYSNRDIEELKSKLLDGDRLRKLDDLF